MGTRLERLPGRRSGSPVGAPMVEAEADAEGDSPVCYSLRIFDIEWLRGRRRIRSFFTAEESERYVAGAAEFLSAVERMLGLDG